MLRRKHPLYGPQLVALVLVVFAMSIAASRPQEPSDKRVGKNWIHILKQADKEIIFQPIVPPIFGAHLDSGDLNDQKLFECEEWNVLHTTAVGKEYPAVEMRCGAITMTIKDLDLTDHQ
jgi:hypothetical protein